MPGDTWTPEEERRLQECIREGLTTPQIAAELGRTYGSVRNKTTYLGGRKAILNRPLQEAQRIVSIPDQESLVARIAELERENSKLRNQLIWAQHGKVASLTGGLLTVARADHHFGDAHHLVTSCRTMEDKVVELVRIHEPERIQILELGDVVSGRGIYKNQDLDTVCTSATEQCHYGAWRIKEFVDGIREVSTAPVEVHHLSGNHDHDNASPMSGYLHLLLQKLLEPAGADVHYHFHRVVRNLAHTGTYNVLGIHGFGHSRSSPQPPSMVSAVKDMILALQREPWYNSDTRIRRAITGHTHWASVVEHGLDLPFDNLGGMQVNTRVRLGFNQRPVGWMVYVSREESDIAEPIPVKPDLDILTREMESPLLKEANHQDVSDCLSKFKTVAKDLGIHYTSEGMRTEGRW